MSTDFSIRPVGSPAPSPIVPPVSPAANNAVPTELPASQSVTAADAGAVVRDDPIDVVEDFVSHQAYFDRDAKAMVYQVVNDKTDQVVTQYPDDAVLRRRAYFHALDLSRGTPPRVVPTDRLA
jgi:hypothetical protein